MLVIIVYCVWVIILRIKNAILGRGVEGKSVSLFGKEK